MATVPIRHSPSIPPHCRFLPCLFLVLSLLVFHLSPPYFSTFSLSRTFRRYLSSFTVFMRSRSYPSAILLLPPFRGSLSRPLAHRSRIIFSSTYSPHRFRPSHFCHRFPRLRLFLLSLSLSRFLGLSVSLSLFPLLRLPPTLSPFPRSPSVSACSNMATRCPITRFILATVFPPPYIRRRRKDPHQPRDARHAVLFSAFPSTARPSIHPYSPPAARRTAVSSHDEIPRALVSPLSHRVRQPDLRSRCKLGNRAEAAGEDGRSD